MTDIENKFRIWLKGKVNTDAPLSSYPNALKKFIPEKLKSIKESQYNNLFDCNNINYLEKLLQRLKKNGDLHQFNIDTQNRVPSAAISKYIVFLEQKDNIVKTNEKIILHPLNQILYGPPGTGKTYNTINKALEILGVNTTNKTRTQLTDEFKKYKKNGQIEFITFHQSYGYEEFIEGIKAKTNEETKQVEYSVEDGVFKNLCNKALKFEPESILNILDNILKTEPLSFTIYNEYEITYKLNKDHGYDFSNNISITRENAKKALQVFLQTNDIEKVNPSDFNDFGDKICANTYFHFAKYEYKIFGQYNDEFNEKNKNYILVIDEINRGNISKIFGELITLIEPSKRIGASEEIKVKLPNSSESFGVPKNLYIIGTMNTADRSIAQIDTALRRRFEFIEMLPQASLLENIVIEGIEVSKILEAINERIEYIYDREHTIGHSYFMSLKDSPTKAKLDEIFKVNIIPLLAEYFYGDWEDIIFVLNNNFIKEKEQSKYIKDSNRTLNKVYEITKNLDKTEYLKIYE